MNVIVCNFLVLGTAGDPWKVERKVFLPGKTCPIAHMPSVRLEYLQIGPFYTEVLTSTFAHVQGVGTPTKSCSFTVPNCQITDAVIIGLAEKG